MKRKLQIREWILSFPRLPPSFEGWSAWLLSDLHFTGRAGRIERAVQSALDARPADALLLAGDVIDFRAHWAETVEWLAALRGAAVRLAVPGNWEYRHGGGLEPFEKHLRAAGFVPLCNAARVFERNGDRLLVAGLDDVREGRPDIGWALEARRPSDFVVGLCHNPDLLLETGPEVFDLLCCGHTHGGQIRLPGYGALHTSTRLGKRYEAGYYTLAPDKVLYVSRGIGGGYLRWRLCCPAEITRLVLRGGGDRPRETWTYV